MSVVKRLLVLACVHWIKSMPFIQRQPLTKKDDGCCIVCTIYHGKHSLCTKVMKVCLISSRKCRRNNTFRTNYHLFFCIWLKHILTKHKYLGITHRRVKKIHSD